MSSISASPDFLMMLIKNKKQQLKPIQKRCVNCEDIITDKNAHWCVDCYYKWRNGEKVRFSHQPKSDEIPPFYLCDNE